ncbi:MAG: tail fiber domain-containing protein [Bacteroidota bacterium]
MKIILLTMVLLINVCAIAQNIGIGTETPLGKLHIKGSADTSQLVIDASATQTANNPVILLRTAGGNELFRIHADNPSDLFIGSQAGLLNQGSINYTNNTFIGSTTGVLNSTGYGNTAVGSSALTQNSSGAENVAIGYTSLYGNTEGSGNTALGYGTLSGNTWATKNTAIGWSVLYNSTGVSNTAVGAAAMKNNHAGYINTAVGVNALFNNSGADASNNTGIGVATLYNTTNSQFNTALGHYAGSKFNNGYNNVFLGANTDVSAAGFFNVIAIGQGTICTASSQVTIGNGATNAYRAYANWSNISDGRFKKNIQENVPGLDFITQLRPVTYNLKATELDNFLHPADNTLQRNDNVADAKSGGNERIAAAPSNESAKAAISKALQQKEQVIQTGFVAQEVEATAKKMGFNFSGIDAPASANDVYGLRYAEFVVPLVKGMQEQQVMIKKQDALIASLQQQINALKTMIKK